MGISLYDHQRMAIDKLKSGSILCGGVGSGKSRTALYYYFSRVCNGRIRVNGRDTYSAMANPLDLYIITTARKRDTHEWEAECVPFLIPNKQVNVTIDSWNNIKKYADVEGAFFIFDEQRVVGYGAWSKAFIKISKKNKWILLSATPGDTWLDYAPVFIANGFFKNITEFKRRHVVYSYYGSYPKVERYIDDRVLAKYRDSILVYMKYKRPTISHNERIAVEYDRDLYKYIMKERWNVFEEQPIKNISELCYLIRKVVNSDPSRIAAMAELIGQHPKSIVFYNFDYELEILKNIDYGDDVAIAEWNGHKHEEIPKTKKWVYLVQYTAGAEGWNCIETDTIIFYSQNYSYKILTQAAGRIDRLNTPFENLYYYHLRSTAPIDIAIYQALKKKKKFNESKFIER